MGGAVASASVAALLVGDRVAARAKLPAMVHVDGLFGASELMVRPALAVPCVAAVPPLALSPYLEAVACANAACLILAVDALVKPYAKAGGRHNGVAVAA